MINDIKSYLYIFAKNLGHNLYENDFNLNEIAKQIEYRLLNNSNFSQIISSVCDKCPLKFEERGSITNKKYKYCISSDKYSKSMPINCPKLGKKQIVFDNTEDDTVEEIRRRGKL